MMRIFATIAALLFTALAFQPAIAQEKGKGGGGEKVTVAERPALPTDLDALFEMRESWGEKPSVTSAEADISGGSDGGAAKKKK